MTEDLCRDVTGCVHLKAGAGHLKGTPVLMFNQVVDQPFWVGIGFLVRWVGYPSTIGNNGLSIRCDPDELCLRHVLEEGWILLWDTVTITTTMTIMTNIVVIAAVATIGGRWGYYSSTMIATQCPKNCDSPPLRSGDSCSAESSHSVQL